MTQKQTVTVYTKPNCQQCEMTKRWLIARDVDFQIADITEDGNLAAAKALGHLAAPVVIVSQGTPGDEVHWAGFQPTRLDESIRVGTAA
ncbi:glutaredoxin domain-containing protein [Frigoribacterium sp. VKM Ac-2530]|uniref:glutaredoxin domain-containing protein n=1 Tax=Frigoribacterium sp. VKM Ac-2530 TaxID=2783822 RepID=UPI00188B29A4|nr:glutaredoxin domain-containing protein [Frigoribacterium sp. VKM Ac-2530]MBF4578934.1 NrdH-redoxin [Frigoribacterium sp. VKM Ac-2530]